MKILSIQPSITQWESSNTIPSILFKSFVNLLKIDPWGVKSKYLVCALVIDVISFLCKLDIAVNVLMLNR